MCTVSFIARQRGYLLGMNRDEQLSRAEALPPMKRVVNGLRVVSPAEPSGGTWIAVNQAGVSFALINWYSVTARVKGKAISRGQIVVSASGCVNSDEVDATLRALPISRINPFRLIGVFPAVEKIVEWGWDLRKFVEKSHPWKSQQWISSGYDEPGAQLSRSKIFRAALPQQSAGRIEWLRRLHRSHQPGRGPFSTCMHRTDARTVSYTEIAVKGAAARIHYHAGPPCCHARTSEKMVPLCNTKIFRGSS